LEPKVSLRPRDVCYTDRFPFVDDLNNLLYDAVSSVRTFSDLVIYFKRLFHIRKDNSLKNLILTENETRGWNSRIKFEIEDSDFPNNIEFFTDVDRLIQAYNIIIELTIEHKKMPDEKDHVKLSLSEKDNRIEFSILHK
jgi:hypothetical protein